MKIKGGLSRQITISMSLLVLGIILLVQISSYILYALLLRYQPEFFANPHDYSPSVEEWVYMGVSTLCSLAIAVSVAGKLSRRILAPLNAVAASLRRVAGGDLAARAAVDDRPIGEASQLVEDFNSMAERLQHMEQERGFWNAAIAHELRTPVTILRGRLQGFTDGVFVPDQAQFRSLLTHVEGLSRLIEDLRIVALAGSGHLELHRVETDLAGDIATVIALAGPALQAAGFRMEVVADGEPVLCDPMRMRQALLALLENARRHATPGRLRIAAVVADGMCALRVEDEGPGIAPELALHVFEAFQRGEQSRSRESGGSGLGLAVVGAIAKAHGGQAACRPSALGGTLFELRWPADHIEVRDTRNA